mmetsp:Transcript_81621/g.141870  ORF Transcript_81621/g.141870 Transcript_81621/m.141870 type:complete len:211 (-) Transcript_81621:281-913(-)
MVVHHQFIRLEAWVLSDFRSLKNHSKHLRVVSTSDGNVLSVSTLVNAHCWRNCGCIAHALGFFTQNLVNRKLPGVVRERSIQHGDVHIASKSSGGSAQQSCLDADNAIYTCREVTDGRSNLHWLVGESRSIDKARHCLGDRVYRCEVAIRPSLAKPTDRAHYEPWVLCMQHLPVVANTLKLPWTPIFHKNICFCQELLKNLAVLGLFFYV